MDTTRVNWYDISYRSRAAKPESNWREKRGQITEVGLYLDSQTCIV